MIDSTAAARACFVLVQPSHPGNIGAAARAIRTMGHADLRIVAPRLPDFRTHPEAIALAAGAGDVLAAARGFAALADALQDVSLAFAMTGYPRQFGPPLLDVAEAARRGAEHVARDPGQVAFVFGGERSGLVNADVERCTFSCAIDADPVNGSLNLAQAVQIAAYESRRAGLAAAATRPPRHFSADPAATAAQLEALHAHFERMMLTVGFLDADRPRHLRARLRRLLARAHPTTAEVAILRGICAAAIEAKSLRAGRPRAVPPRDL
jgi:tRNA/rRNA methyltransferase